MSNHSDRLKVYRKRLDASTFPHWMSHGLADPANPGVMQSPPSCCEYLWLELWAPKFCPKCGASLGEWSEWKRKVRNWERSERRAEAKHEDHSA